MFHRGVWDHFLDLIFRICCVIQFCNGAVWFCVLGLCFVFAFVLSGLPTMPRCRSFLPDLTTVRAVMVRAAMEQKKKKRNIAKHPARKTKCVVEDTGGLLPAKSLSQWLELEAAEIAFAISC